MMATVNSSFLRRSGVRNALRNAESNVFLLRAATAAVTAERGGLGRCPTTVDRTLTYLARTSGGRPPRIHRERYLSGAVTGSGARRQLNRTGATTPTAYSSVTEPPAAAIFSLADALNACAVTW